MTGLAAGILFLARCIFNGLACSIYFIPTLGRILCGIYFLPFAIFADGV